METRHVKLDYEEALNAKKQILSAELNLLQTEKRVRNYKILRKKELITKTKLRTALKSLRTKINSIRLTLPEEGEKMEIKAIKKRAEKRKNKDIKKQLIKQGIKIEKTQQVLGCSKVKTNLPILLISTGKFHAQNLYLQTPILYTFENNKIIRISNKDIARIKAYKKTALMKFFKAERIGILVSTKPGQQFQGKDEQRKPLGFLGKALVLKKKLENKGKQPYIFISNNIDITQFENFNIDSWINTACPGLSMDNPNIINIDDLPN